jgi:type VI secretion system protein ImpM
MPASTLSSAAVPGWFGKIPNLGDFASRRLPDNFIRVWDDWLQRGMATARDALGDAWPDAYLEAPIRRFWLGPGVLGAASWAGLMMPSVDRVGRHFPLTIASVSEGLASVLAACEWFRALDGAARQVLDEDCTIDELEGTLARISPMPDGAPAHELAGTLLRPFGEAAGCSVWWCDDAGPATPFLCVVALPPAESFATLLAPSGSLRCEG